jgi:hypothetical protein
MKTDVDAIDNHMVVEGGAAASPGCALQPYGS